MEITLPKPENSLPKQEEQTQKVNDFGLRVVLIPLFAFAVPNLTGLINYHYSFTTILIHYAYFFLISFSIYFGNRFLLFELSDKFNWFFSPFRKVLTLISGVMLFTIPITIFFIAMYYLCIINTEINWQVMRNVTLMNVICVIFVAHIYETVFLIKQTESEMLKAEKLERCKAEAELEALKNQIDPHFIFNSLNTLSHLIEKNPPKAKQFNDTLADVYRYILQNKGRNLVLLREEIAFLQNYFDLLKIRFENAVQFINTVDGSLYDTILIPPISLQTLMENVVKHNEFSDDSPLLIEMKIENDTLQFKNNLRTKKLRKISSKIGLANLNERYKLTTEKEIQYTEKENVFVVQLPILRTI